MVTSALETVGQYIEECRRLLQDEISIYRYPDDDIVDGLNIALQEARRLRADLFIPVNFAVPWFSPSGTINTAAPVPMDPMYRSSLVYYIVGRMQLRDDEPTTDSRAAALLLKFTQQMLVIAS
jgi:hypothetical protein